MSHTTTNSSSNNNSNSNHRVEYTRISSTPDNNTALSSETATTTTTNTKPPPTPFSLSQQQSSSSSSNTNNTPNNTTNNNNNNNGVPIRSITEKITDKIFAAIWVTMAGIVLHYTDSLHVYRLLPNADSTTNTNDNNTYYNNDPTMANPILMQIVFIGCGINTILILYLLIYLPYIKGLNDTSSWDIYCPKIIPCITIISICIFILLIRATWSIWGFLAPLIIGIETIGLLYITHFIPICF